MPNIETEEQRDKIIAAVKEYHKAKHATAKAASFEHDKLSVLKNLTGESSNNGPAIEEVALRMLGNVQIYGVPEAR
jgi:hypothetical protein